MKLVLVNTIHGNHYAVQKGFWIFKKYMRFYDYADSLDFKNGNNLFVTKSSPLFKLCLVKVEDIDVIRDNFPQVFKDQFEIIEDQKAVRERMQ